MSNNTKNIDNYIQIIASEVPTDACVLLDTDNKKLLFTELATSASLNSFLDIINDSLDLKISTDGTIPFINTYTPINNQDPATKKYVDDAVAGGGGGGGGYSYATQMPMSDIDATKVYDAIITNSTAITATNDIIITLQGNISSINTSIDTINNTLPTLAPLNNTYTLDGLATMVDTYTPIADTDLTTKAYTDNLFSIATGGEVKSVCGVLPDALGDVPLTSADTGSYSQIAGDSLASDLADNYTNTTALNTLLAGKYSLDGSNTMLLAYTPALATDLTTKKYVDDLTGAVININATESVTIEDAIAGNTALITGLDTNLTDNYYDKTAIDATVATLATQASLNTTNDNVATNASNIALCATQSSVDALNTDIANINTSISGINDNLSNNYTNNTDLALLLADYETVIHASATYATQASLNSTNSDLANNYYTKVQTNFLLADYTTTIDTQAYLNANYYNKTDSDLRYVTSSTLTTNYYDKTTSDGKYALQTALSTTNSNVSANTSAINTINTVTLPLYLTIANASTTYATQSALSTTNTNVATNTTNITTNTADITLLKAQKSILKVSNTTATLVLSTTPTLVNLPTTTLTLGTSITKTSNTLFTINKTGYYNLLTRLRGTQTGAGTNTICNIDVLKNGVIIQSVGITMVDISINTYNFVELALALNATDTLSFNVYTTGGGGITLSTTTPNPLASLTIQEV